MATNNTPNRTSVSAVLFCACASQPLPNSRNAAAVSQTTGSCGSCRTRRWNPGAEPAFVPERLRGTSRNGCQAWVTAT